MRSARLALVATLVAGVVAVQTGSASAGNESIPYYEQILPVCPAQYGVPADPCHMPGNEADAPGIVIVPCDSTRNVTNFCYTATVNGAPAPATLKILGYMTAYKLHDTSVGNAQIEANIVAYHVPQGAELGKGELWGWGKRPANQNGNGGRVDLSSVLTADDTLKVEVKYRSHKLPQYSVLVANNGKMSFGLSGDNLTVTMEGKPARVAIESAAQHIDFDTEKSDDATKPWTDRCGIPSMQFVVCNVDRAESNPLLFYGRSSTFVNSPGGDVPGPIWVSTNGTYFHQPAVSVDAKGNAQIQVRVAAPHFLADGTTVNSGPFRAFLSNGILERWKIPKTAEGLDKALAASVRKAGVESVVDRTFEINDTGVMITFPNLTYSSPEVYVTAISTTTGGSQNANQLYQALLAGTSGSTSGSTSGTTSGTTTWTTTSTGKSLKKGSATVLTRLIAVSKGQTAAWTVRGTACRIKSGKLYAMTKGKTCTLTLKQKNAKTKVTTTKTLSITVT